MEKLVKASEKLREKRKKVLTKRKFCDMLDKLSRRAEDAQDLEN